MAELTVRLLGKTLTVKNRNNCFLLTIIDRVVDGLQPDDSSNVNFKKKRVLYHPEMYNN